MKFYHASPRKNRKEIETNGLRLKTKSSGYGKAPTKTAIYLFHKNNIDVAMDMVDIFGYVDIYEVTILDQSKLVADEDSQARTWLGSVERMGTLAYEGDIPPEQIKRVGVLTKNRKNQILYLKKILTEE